jgi:hypothetical protein
LRWGALPGGLGVCIVIAGALAGALITVLASSDPGLALGVFTVAGTVAAAFAVKPHSAHVIVPVPALAYVVMATMTGLIHDGSTAASTTTFAVNLAQWVASGFLTIIVATVLAIGIALYRRRMTPTAPGTGRGPSSPGYSRSEREPGDSRSRPGYPRNDPDYMPPAGRSGRSVPPRRPDGSRTASSPRRPDRDVDYPGPPGSRGPRGGDGRYEPRDPGPRNQDPYDRWYRTDSRLVPASPEH